MGRFAIVTIFTTMLAISCGCQPKQSDVAPPPPPVENQIPQTQSIIPPAAIPSPAQPAPEPAKIETPNEPEPNISAAPPITVSEPNIKPAETENTQPKVAEVNSTETKSVQTSALTPDELCKKSSAFLNKFVDKDGFVDYKALLRKKIELHEIINDFKNIDKKTYSSWSPDDKIAFWINAYNIEITKIIVDSYPIQPSRMLLLFWPPNSIRHIKGIWDEHKFIMMGEEFTLKGIEDQVFKKEFNEPRIFLAISFASLSGPPLRNEAYCGQNLSQQLDDQVKRYLASSHAFKIDRENKIVNLSSILKTSWHGQDFLAKYGTDMKFKQQEPEVRAVLNFLTKYITTEQADFLETANYTIEYMIYDWTLNERGSSKAE
jgi:hypothetical protein